MSEKDLTLKEAAKLADDIRSGAVKPGKFLKTFSDTLVTLAACQDAMEFVGSQSLEEAWATCERGDWMMWLARTAHVDRRILVAVCTAFTRTALQYQNDPRLEACLDVVDRWVRGEATREEVLAARDEVSAACTATAEARATFYTVNAAALDDAPIATIKAVVRVAAENASFVVYPAYKQQADIVRRIISVDVVREALGGIQ